MCGCQAKGNEMRVTAKETREQAEAENEIATQFEESQPPRPDDLNTAVLRMQGTRGARLTVIYSR